MFSIPANTQVYSPFGSYVFEHHDAGSLQRYLDDIPRPDLQLGKEHPLARQADDEREAA